MKTRTPVTLCATLALISCSSCNSNKSLPNIVYVLADDLGYGDLSCYGQQKVSTPNIDRLAQQGMLFRQHYAGCTVSAPSRSSLLTGLHTGHTPIRGNKEILPEGQWPLPSSSITVAEILKTKGYATGVFGKWGLGSVGTEGDPNMQGFDEFFGYNCQRMAHNYYPYYLWHNNTKVILTGNEGTKTGNYAPDKIHDAALKFIETNKDKPFFLMYTTNLPHAELFAKEEYMSKFRGKFDPEVNYAGIDSGNSFRIGGYGSQPYPHAAFAAMVTELDDYVGELVARIKELGLEKNTIFVFTSDNGPHFEGGADPDYFNSNGEFNGYKRDMTEGGIRVPMIVKWPGKVAKRSVSDHVSAFWDVLPTFAEITGANIPEGIDGISFFPALLGKEQKQHEYLYWEFHEEGAKTALRMGDWKAIKLDVDKVPQGVTKLYNLTSDIGETNDLASSNPEVVKKMEELMKQAHIKSEIFPFSYEPNTK
ncbi:MAG: arylsulfatase [Bacteroidales bacterium]|nr:arylsulfatase [Bacteroidales bacterium]